MPSYESLACKIDGKFQSTSAHVITPSSARRANFHKKSIYSVIMFDLAANPKTSLLVLGLCETGDHGS